MKGFARLLAVCSALLLFVPAANADWSDNFDSYALNSGLDGQGGWAGWEANPAYDAYVTDIQAYSAPHSAGITPTSDIVQEFDGLITGEWQMNAWHYIPTGSTGMQYYIMLNRYAPDSIAGANWSIQLEFDTDAGTVTDYYSSASTTMLYDQWVEIQIDILLDQNMCDTYYNGTYLGSWTWHDGTGANAIAAIDLFSDGGSTIYWDDLNLVQTAITLQHTTWGNIKTLMQ